MYDLLGPYKVLGVGMLSDLKKLLLAYSFLPGIGRVRLAKLLIEFGYAHNPPDDLLKQHLNISNYTHITCYLSGQGEIFNRVESAAQQMIDHNIFMCLNTDDEYPALLKEIPDSPVFFFYKGNIEVLHMRQIAIVGSRKASGLSLRTAYTIAQELFLAGFAVTSGLAYGIDHAAHCGALDASGNTVAVMATGLDIVYPRQHNGTAQNILHQGCWVSEYLVGTKPVAANFPSRNRIISGLSLATLIVEARIKSGTLITARMALEQNREVLAVPGPIEYEGSKGCHQLIKEGAGLVECCADIVDSLNLLNHFNVNNNPISNMIEKPNVCVDVPAIFDHLGFDLQSIDQLSASSGLSITELTSILVNLEINGEVESLADCYKRI